MIQPNSIAPMLNSSQAIRSGNAVPRFAWRFAMAAMLSSLFSGCAALTNPVAHGVPVHILPEELIAESKEGFEPIPLPLLQQAPPKIYELAAGDTLGVYIEGVLGDAETPPPVNISESTDQPPSIGYPFPIRKDGTLSLPYVGAIHVAGLSIEGAQKVVVDAYLEKKILRPEDQRILITLLRPRHIKVLVIRDDSQERQRTLRRDSLFGLGTAQTVIGGSRHGEGMVLELPAYQNDVLNALTRSGGLPGLESRHEVVIQRAYGGTGEAPEPCAVCQTEGTGSMAKVERSPGKTRIPLRVRKGGQVDIRPEDIILHDNDILTVRARDPEFYYTGGILPANEFPMPNDYDLSVVEAVLKARGSLVNGGVNTSNFNGALIPPGMGGPSPSLLTVLRKLPNGSRVNIRVDLNEALRDPREDLLVQAGDVLILQQTAGEAVARYFTQTFNLNLFGRFINRADAQGSASLVVP